MGVEDLLADGDKSDGSKRYALSAVCTMENLPTYRLDPPRGNAQHALVTISALVGDTFVVDRVQLLSQDEAVSAAASMKMLIHLAGHLHDPRRKRSSGPWTEEFSPAIAKRCRILGESPTDDGIPALSM